MDGELRLACRGRARLQDGLLRLQRSGGVEGGCRESRHTGRWRLHLLLRREVLVPGRDGGRLGPSAASGQRPEAHAWLGRVWRGDWSLLAVRRGAGVDAADSQQWAVDDAGSIDEVRRGEEVLLGHLLGPARGQRGKAGAGDVDYRRDELVGLEGGPGCSGDAWNLDVETVSVVEDISRQTEALSCVQLILVALLLFREGGGILEDSPALGIGVGEVVQARSREAGAEEGVPPAGDGGVRLLHAGEGGDGVVVVLGREVD